MFIYLFFFFFFWESHCRAGFVVIFFFLFYFLYLFPVVGFLLIMSTRTVNGNFQTGSTIGYDAYARAYTITTGQYQRGKVERWIKREKHYHYPANARPSINEKLTYSYRPPLMLLLLVLFAQLVDKNFHGYFGLVILVSFFFFFKTKKNKQIWPGQAWWSRRRG